MYIPKLYHDEILYSYISRLFYYNLIYNWRDIKKIIFQGKGYVANASIDSNIENIDINLFKIDQKNITSKIILENHTIYKYISIFMTKNQRESIRNMMLNSGNSLIRKSRLYEQGLYNNERRSIKFCPYCAREDYMNFGETYLRSIHQIPGNNICLKHKCYLAKVDVSKLGIRRFYDISEIRNKMNEVLEELQKVQLEEVLKTHQNIIDLLERITEKYRDQFDLNDIIDKLNVRIMKKGYKFIEINHKKLLEDFKEYYSAEVLENYSITISDYKDCWLYKIFRKGYQPFHIIKYLLIINP